MARLKYGSEFEGGPLPRSQPFAASQIFHEKGGAIVYADGSGNMVGALTATATLFGWAILGFSPDAPGVTGAAGSRILTTDSTAGASSFPVKAFCGADVFWMPPDATPTQAIVGNACDIIGVNDGTKQLADVGTSSTDVLRIVGQDGTDVLVMVNPAKLQADT